MATGFDPLSSEERERLLQRPRPRALPIVPAAAPPPRRLPLASEVRPQDSVRPIYAVWEITLRCDLACRHCGSRAGHARSDELSTEECLDLVRQMKALDVKEITLIGGEAYLRDDWLDIVREISRLGMSVTMTTGGRALSAERALKAREAGLKSASVSLDGLQATHDRLRGVNGSFASALSAMTNLRRAGIPVSTNTQINRLSMPELPELLEIIAAEGAHSWQLQLTVPMGRGADEPDVLLEPYDLLELFPLLARLKQRSLELGVLIWPGNNIGYFGPHEAALRGHLPLGHMASCGAGRAVLGIEADGSIKGCPSLPTGPWTGGNIRDATLEEIWERSAPLRYTRDRTVEDLWGFCRTCYYAETCMAGCTWTSFVFFGKAGNNPYCHHRALELARGGQRERLRQVESAPGEPFDYSRFELVLEADPTLETGS